MSALILGDLVTRDVLGPSLPDLVRRGHDGDDELLFWAGVGGRVRVRVRVGVGVEYSGLASQTSSMDAMMGMMSFCLGR